jgi:cytoskeletal protein CcmA (bactofilin family)
MSGLKSALGYLGLATESSTTGEASLAGRPERDSEEGRVLARGLSFRGDLSGQGDFHVMGKFEGEINVVGRLIVAQGAEVDANISASAIVIGGTVRGNLSASTRVEILPSGVLTGTLRTGSFLAADGSSVKGEVWIERGDTPGHRNAGSAP